MNSRMKLILTGGAAFAAGVLLVFYFMRAQPKFSGENGEGATASPIQLKHSANGNVIVVLDADTQQRLGLKTEILAATQWQPEAKGFGRVVDPAVLSAAVADLKSMETAADVSKKEFERLKNLSEQNNISAKNLEAAQVAATHDELAATATRVKFIADWGRALANNENDELKTQIFSRDVELVRIDLPAGEFLTAPPNAARIVALTDETKSVNATYFDTTAGVDSQTQSQTFFFLVKNNLLTADAAVTGFLKISGEPTGGMIVPTDAVLRHEGENWIYIQTSEKEFTRREIQTDRAVENGWFISGELTNCVVVSGAQAVLSAELSGAGFNAGTSN